VIYDKVSELVERTVTKNDKIVKKNLV